MRNLIIVFLLAPLCGWAAEAGYRLDRSPHDLHDLISLQAGPDIVSLFLGFAISGLLLYRCPYFKRALIEKSGIFKISQYHVACCCKFH